MSDWNSPEERERLGRIVREAWVAWATTQPSPKPTWLVPWEGLAEPDKEADRQIGEAVALALGYQPSPSGWREGPPPKGPDFWFWRRGAAPAIRHAVLCSPGGVMVTGGGIMEPWASDMRWQPLVPPAPPEVTP